MMVSIFGSISSNTERLLGSFEFPFPFAIYVANPVVSFRKICSWQRTMTTLWWRMMTMMDDCSDTNCWIGAVVVV